MSPQQQLTRDATGASTNGTSDERDALAAPFPYGAAETTEWSNSLAAATPGVATCPDCDGEAINGQGVLDCPECDWVGTR